MFGILSLARNILPKATRGMEDTLKRRDFSSALWALDKDADFEHKGIQGIASFNGKELELTIPMGCLLDRTPINEMVACGMDPIEVPVAFGFCQTGERITLMDLSTLGPSFSVSGIKHEDLRATSALVCGTSFISPNPNIQSLTLQISGLWNWVGRYFGEVKHTFKDDKWAETLGVWRSDILEPLPLFASDKVSISLQPVMTQKDDRFPLQEFSMKSDLHLQIKFIDHALPLDDAMNQWVYPTWRMLTFCMGFMCSIDEVEIKTEDNQSALYYLPLIEGEENPSKAQLNHMPLSYSFISQSRMNFLESWLHLDGDAKRAATILTGVHGSNRIRFLDPMFTTVSGAFEAISRVGERTQDIASDRFQRIKARIEQCFEDNTDAQWVLQKVNNIPPASDYASSLVEKLGAFADYVIPDKSRFLKDLRKNRNAYVHQTSALNKASTFSNAELYSLTMAVKVLCYGAVMLQLGMTPEAILNQFKTSHFCQTEIHYARKMYLPRLEDSAE